MNKSQMDRIDTLVSEFVQLFPDKLVDMSIELNETRIQNFLALTLDTAMDIAHDLSTNDVVDKLTTNNNGDANRAVKSEDDVIYLYYSHFVKWGYIVYTAITGKVNAHELRVKYVNGTIRDLVMSDHTFTAYMISLCKEYEDFKKYALPYVEEQIYSQIGKEYEKYKAENADKVSKLATVPYEETTPVDELAEDQLIGEYFNAFRCLNTYYQDPERYETEDQKKWYDRFKAISDRLYAIESTM